MGLDKCHSFVYDNGAVSGSDTERPRLRPAFDTWSSIEVVITSTTGNRVGVLSASRVRISPTPPKSRHPIWDAVIFCGAERFELKIGTVRWTVPAASANTGGFAYFCQRQKCKRISPTPPSRPPPRQCRRGVHNRPIRDFGEAKMQTNLSYFVAADCISFAATFYVSHKKSLLTHFVAAPLKMVTASLGHDFAISPCLTHLNIQKAFV